MNCHQCKTNKKVNDLVFCGHISIDAKGYSTTCTEKYPRTRTNVEYLALPLLSEIMLLSSLPDLRQDTAGNGLHRFGGTSGRPKPSQVLSAKLARHPSPTCSGIRAP